MGVEILMELGKKLYCTAKPCMSYCTWRIPAAKHKVPRLLSCGGGIHRESNLWLLPW